MKKRIILIIIIGLFLLMIPLMAGAETNGTCGTSVNWTLDDNGVLTISGTGNMTSHPWDASSVKQVMIENGVTSIGNSAFYNCSSLTSINIPAGVTSIGNFAFYNCSSLTSINIPDGVTSIGNYVFYNCSSLTSVNIPAGVTSIGDSAFSACSSLTSINILDGVTSIGNYVFYNCSSLTSVNIPAGVTSIGYSAFYNCSSLTSINIPDGVTSIGNSAFYNCSSLTSINIPDGVTSIGDSAFFACSSLTSINIPDGVTSIGNYVFYNCSSLTEVWIPNGVTAVGQYAFHQNTVIIAEMDSVTAHSLCKAGYVFRCPGDNYDLQYLYDGEVQTGLALIRVNQEITSFTIPEYVTVIGKEAFRDCTALTGIIIPEGVTDIGDSAFYNCSSMTSISIPDSLIHTGSNSFSGCNSLTEIHISSIRSWVSADYEYYPNSNYMISNCHLYLGDTELTSITIPDDITRIPDNSFEHFVNITDVTFPDGLTYIGIGAFAGCKSLTSISIPDSVTEIGYSAFSSCNMKDFTIPRGITEIGNECYIAPYGIENLYIHKTLKKIGTFVFYSCSKLKNIYFDGTESEWNAISIGANNPPLRKATLHCTYASGTFGSDISWVLTNTGILTLYGSGTLPDTYYSAYSYPWYQYRDRIKAVVVKEGISNIGYNMFSGYGNLASVYLPNTVTAIDSGAFYNCSSLEKVFLPDGVMSVAVNSFTNTPAILYVSVRDSETAKVLSASGFDFRVTGNPYNLRYLFTGDTISGLELRDCDQDTVAVVIPDDVTSIGNSAFSGCSSFSSIVIPSGVTSIGSSAFSGCSGLEEVFLPDGVLSVAVNSFTNTPAILYVNVRDSETAKSLSASGFDFRVTGNPYSLRYLFTGDTISGLEITDCDQDIVEIVIPDDVTRIGNSAFSGCSSFSSIIIPSGVTSIGNSAFSECSSLTGITIPDGVVSIGDYAFSNCAKLSSISVPDSVTSVGSHAFDGNCRIKTNKCSDIAFLWAVENNNPCETTKHEGITIDAFIAPTCTETGLTEGKHCSVCGTVLVSQELIVANGHHIVTDIEAKAPGCLIAGHTAASHCDVCNEILESSTEIPPTGHQPVTDHYIPATYSSTGLTEGSHCGACGIILKDQKIIPVKSGLQSETEFEDGNGFIYSLSCSTTHPNYILYHDLVNRKNLTLTYAIFAQYADGSTDLALIQKTAGNVDDSSSYGDIVDGSLRVFQHDLYSNEDGTVATFGFILSKPATVYATLTGGGLSKRTQDVPIYTTYINYYGAWALKYSQSGSSVIDVSNDGKYKDYRIYLEQDGRAFYVDDEGPLEVEWQVNDNALNIFGLSFIPLDNGDVAMPLGSTLRNIYRKVDDGLTVSGLQGRLGTWKAYMAVKEPEGVQVPISMLNDSVAKRVYLHADNTVYIPYGDGGPIQCGKVSVNNSDIYIDGVKSDFSFNQYGQLIRHLSDDITLLYMPVGDASSIPDIVKYAGPWYAESIIEMGYQRIADIAGLEDFLSLDAVIYLDGRIVIHYCGKEESGTWTVKNGYFETQGLSRAISFSALGELLFDLGNENYLCCGRNEPSGTGRKLSLPSSLTKIEEEAFYGTNETIIVVPKRCRTIGARAFGNCPNLTYVYMPDSVASISNDAFINSPCVVLICESDNAAAQFARQRNINYFIH